MASVWERVGNWFTRQRQEYEVQRLFARRDAIARDAMQTQERQAAAIDGAPGLSVHEREERQLDMRRELYFGAGDVAERYQDSQSRLMDALAVLHPNGFGPGYRPQGRGIGAFFGRLLNGRATQAALDRSNAEQQTFSTMPGFSVADGRRLDELRALREGRPAAARDILQQVKADPQTGEQRREAMFKATQTLYAEQGKTPPATFEEFEEMRSRIHNERQMQAFMRPGEDRESLEHNVRVMRVLTDVDEHGKYRDQAGIRDLVRGKIQEMNAAFDVASMDLGDFYRMRTVYPALEQHYTAVHSIMDVTKASGGVSRETFREIFPAEQDYLRFAVGGQFAMLAADHTRAQLMKDAGDRREDLLAREAGKYGENPAQAREDKERRLQGNAGLQGSANYQGYYNAMREKNALPRNPMAADAPPARERVTAASLDARSPARHSAQTQAAPDERTHREPTQPGIKR